MNMVFVRFHDINVKIRIVSDGLKNGFDVIIKLPIKYFSSVFDTENQMTL